MPEETRSSSVCETTQNFLLTLFSPFAWLTAYGKEYSSQQSYFKISSEEDIEEDIIDEESDFSAEDYFCFPDRLRSPTNIQFFVRWIRFIQDETGEKIKTNGLIFLISLVVNFWPFVNYFFSSLAGGEMLEPKDLPETPEKVWPYFTFGILLGLVSGLLNWQMAQITTGKLTTEQLNSLANALNRYKTLASINYCKSFLAVLNDLACLVRDITIFSATFVLAIPSASPQIYALTLALSPPASAPQTHLNHRLAHLGMSQSSQETLESLNYPWMGVLWNTFMALGFNDFLGFLLNWISDRFRGKSLEKSSDTLSTLLIVITTAISNCFRWRSLSESQPPLLSTARFLVTFTLAFGMAFLLERSVPEAMMQAANSPYGKFFLNPAVSWIWWVGDLVQFIQTPKSFWYLQNIFPIVPSFITATYLIMGIKFLLKSLGDLLEVCISSGKEFGNRLTYEIGLSVIALVASLLSIAPMLLETESNQLFQLILVAINIIILNYVGTYLKTQEIFGCFAKQDPEEQARRAKRTWCEWLCTAPEDPEENADLLAVDEDNDNDQSTVELSQSSYRNLLTEAVQENAGELHAPLLDEEKSIALPLPTSRTNVKNDYYAKKDHGENMPKIASDSCWKTGCWGILTCFGLFSSDETTATHRRFHRVVPS